MICHRDVPVEFVCRSDSSAPSLSPSSPSLSPSLGVFVAFCSSGVSVSSVCVCVWGGGGGGGVGGLMMYRLLDVALRRCM